jgi:hypothetical protein
MCDEDYDIPPQGNATNAEPPYSSVPVPPEPEAEREEPITVFEDAALVDRLRNEIAELTAEREHWGQAARIYEHQRDEARAECERLRKVVIDHVEKGLSMIQAQLEQECDE